MPFTIPLPTMFSVASGAWTVMPDNAVIQCGECGTFLRGEIGEFCAHFQTRLEDGSVQVFQSSGQTLFLQLHPVRP